MNFYELDRFNLFLLLQCLSGLCQFVNCLLQKIEIFIQVIDLFEFVKDTVGEILYRLSMKNMKKGKFNDEVLTMFGYCIFSNKNKT